MKKTLLLFILVSFMACDKKPPEPTGLYNKYRRSVALIKNSYYIKTTLDNGFKFYYTLDKDEPIFYDEEEDAINNAGVSYGTGFFISTTGELATNRHVVYPNLGNELMSVKINDHIKNFKFRLGKILNETQNEQNKLISDYNEYYDYLTYEERNEIRDKHTENKNTILDLENYLENLEFNPKNTKTEVIRLFLGIALDDTHVTTSSDFLECVAIKKSENEDVDLAIIQLKNKTTPSTAAHIFKLERLKGDELKLNDPVYMIGYNHGIALAKTDDGIKSQFTQGTITQDPSKNTILYSIPTLPGSSGSPIIDKWGNLVAINFAKISNTQGFSFGVPSLALNNLYNNNTSTASTDNYVQNTTVSNSRNSGSKKDSSKSTDFSSNIRSFLKAEENRDFESIYSFFSPRISRYYDISSPEYNQLLKRYEYLWGFTSDSKNNVKSIDKINDYTYDVKTEFSYYNIRKEEEISVISKIRFLFDADGKIIETYGVK